MSAIASIAAFLADHADLLETLFKALTSGVSKEALKESIEKAMVDASDAVIYSELPPGS